DCAITTAGLLIRREPPVGRRRGVRYCALCLLSANLDGDADDDTDGPSLDLGSARAERDCGGARKAVAWVMDGTPPIRGSSPIRAKTYGSVLCAMSRGRPA